MNPALKQYSDADLKALYFDEQVKAGQAQTNLKGLMEELNARQNTDNEAPKKPKPIKKTNKK